MSPPNELEAELEKIGEAQVCLKLAQKAYGSGKKPIVEAWLRKKEEEKRESIQKHETEHKKTEIEIARSAKNAAWFAAIAAAVSIVVSVIALIVSLKSS